MLKLTLSILFLGVLEVLRLRRWFLTKMTPCRLHPALCPLWMPVDTRWGASSTLHNYSNVRCMPSEKAPG